MALPGLMASLAFTTFMATPSRYQSFPKNSDISVLFWRWEEKQELSLNTALWGFLLLQNSVESSHLSVGKLGVCVCLISIKETENRDRRGPLREAIQAKRVKTGKEQKRSEEHTSQSIQEMFA